MLYSGIKSPAQPTLCCCGIENAELIKQPSAERVLGMGAYRRMRWVISHIPSLAIMIHLQLPFKCRLQVSIFLQYMENSNLLILHAHLCHLLDTAQICSWCRLLRHTWPQSAVFKFISEAPDCTWSKVSVPSYLATLHSWISFCL